MGQLGLIWETIEDEPGLRCTIVIIYGDIFSPTSIIVDSDDKGSWFVEAWDVNSANRTYVQSVGNLASGIIEAQKWVANHSSVCIIQP